MLMNEGADTSANPAEEAYSAINQLTREGRFAEALERHEWFHRYALEHRPSYYGVRLSFALSAWKELGEKYPPALESLKRIRDENTTCLRGAEASDELFHDVVSINRTLGDGDASVALFREIETVDNEAAKRRFRYLKETALQHDPDLFLRYTPDLVGYMTSQRGFYQHLKTSRLQLAQTQARFADAINKGIENLESQFEKRCARLIDLAESADRAQQASDMKQLVHHWQQENQGGLL